MTFKEAKLIKIEEKLAQMECAFEQRDKEHLAQIICAKVCNKINCSDCIIGDGKKCHGNIENARNSYIKEVVDWAELKVPKSLCYLLNEASKERE